MATVLRFFLRVVLFAAALVFAVSLAVAFGLLVLVWAVRRTWARLTGRPVQPFVARFGVRQGFSDVMARARPGGARRLAPQADVTDVVARDLPLR
ncbi:hypothetical protein [Ramlibacter sp.]|uniref:hypothetical protein n=1 Tax=Ramlibacter sp. TaxID=1917967 RepID=UPI0035B1DF01